MPLPEQFCHHPTAGHRIRQLILIACICLMTGNSRAASASEPPANDQVLKAVRDKITATSKRARKFEQQAKTLDHEIDSLSENLVTAASEIQDLEGEVYDKEDHLTQLDRQEKSLTQALKTRYGQMAKTLAAMQRLSQQPVKLVAFRPDTAINSLRSASLLKILQPELKRRADNIRHDMTDLQVMREQITKEQQELNALLAALTSEQIEMNQLLADRRLKQKDLRRATQVERRKLKDFAARAKSLQELIASIEREKAEREKAALAAAQRLKHDLSQKPANAKIKTRTKSANAKSARARLGALLRGDVAFRKAKGTLPLPVRGAIRRTYGSKSSDGIPSEGITIHTLPRATVVSPHEGRIVFAGKFRSYGLLLIIAHGPEYHMLLAGMTRLDAEVGQWVLKGEPIGQMAAGPQTAQMSGTGAIAGAGQNLYVELRRMGKPINPLPWIAARDRKVL